nr:MAG TPA: hypothetical protein [Caudoviricetes sp.]
MIPPGSHFSAVGIHIPSPAVTIHPVNTFQLNPRL